MEAPTIDILGGLGGAKETVGRFSYEDLVALPVTGCGHGKFVCGGFE